MTLFGPPSDPQDWDIILPLPHNYTDGEAVGWDNGDESPVLVNLHTVAWIVAGCFALLAILVSTHLIAQHNLNFTNPMIQRKIMGLLWMVPIFAVDSWLSLRFHTASVYLDMFRDCYEAYVIYLFLALMIAYLGDGDEYLVVDIIETLPPLQHPFPFSKFCKPIPMDRSFLQRCKLGALQFVVLKPTLTVIAAILETQGLYCQGQFRLDRGYAYVTFVQNISISVAFYELVLFYIALHDHLAPYNPVPKFISLKAVLFLSFWQGVFLAGLARFNYIHEIGSWTVEDVSTGVQNLLICFEMFFAAIGHLYAFPVDEFRIDRSRTMSMSSASASGSSARHSMRARLLRDNFAVGDAVRDFNEVMPGRVVLPTGFRPGDAIIVTRTPEPSSVLEDNSDSESVGHPDEYMSSRSFAVGLSANITVEQYDSLMRDAAAEEEDQFWDCASEGDDDDVGRGGDEESGSGGRPSSGGVGRRRSSGRAQMPSSSKGKDMGGWQL